jgi:DNA-binding CsgD family transcriptional regulator
MTRIVLSTRERDVLLGMSFGMVNSDIGKKLIVGEDTVKTHNRRLFQKIGARDRAHATRLGFELGLLQPRRLPLGVRVEHTDTSGVSHTAACWAAAICPCRATELGRRGSTRRSVTERVQALLVGRPSYKSDAQLLVEIARVVGLDTRELTA